MKLLAASLIVVVAISGCASQADQQAAAQAEAAASRAEESAAHAEQAATQALDAANKATEAANRATKAVEDATAEINRVSDHMDQMEKDREAATHGRRLSHVTNAARRASTGRAPNPEASPSPGAATPTK